MTDSTRPIQYVLAAIGIASIAACSNMQQAQTSVEKVRAVATELRDANVAQSGPATVHRTRRPRLAGEEVVLRSAAALPALFSKQVTFTTQGQPLADALETVSGLIAIPIRANEITVADAAGLAPSSTATSITGRVSIEFQGSVRSLLDELAARSNASWRFVAAKRTVEFYRYETRTLSVNVPAGPKELSASISLAGVSGGSGGGGGASTGAGNVSVSQGYTVDPWGSLMRGVQSILSEGAPTPAIGSATSGGGASSRGGAGLTASGPAGQAAASPELGIITVTARPATMERVANYLASINARFAQNVLVDVKIYSLTLDQQASAGFSLDLLYNRLSRYGVTVAGAAPLQPATGSPGQITISSSDPNSRWSGSQLVAQALSQFGNVALQTQGQVLAVNGQPSPIQVANEVNYLASSATTQTPNVGSTTTLTPGTRVVGFTAAFTPVVLGNNQILLNYQMQISSLTALTQINSGTSSIQTPQISSQSLQQSAYLRDGEAIVLFGFDQSRDTVDSALHLAGASRASRSERQMVVIVIQVNGGTRNVV